MSEEARVIPARFGALWHGGDRLSPREARLVASLLAGGTLAAAARRAGLPRRTAHRYLGRERVRRAIAAGMDAVLEAAVAEAGASLLRGMRVLGDVVADPGATVSLRGRAALTLVGLAMNAREREEQPAGHSGTASGRGAGQ